MGNRSSQKGLPTRSTTTTQTFLDTCVLDDDHKALKEYLVNNPVQQNDLDRCLLRGLQIVQLKERAFPQVAPSLTLLLQSGAKWSSDTLLDEKRTPYHVICESPGDHHEVLDLLIKSSQQSIIDTQDKAGHTALRYAVLHSNINCCKCLIACGADINISNDSYQYLSRGAPPQEPSAIIEAIRMLRFHSKYTSVNEDIFDLLLDKFSFKCYMPLLTVAASFCSIYCIKKLIKKGVNPSIIGQDQRYVWPTIARVGDVDLLKMLFIHGTDKDSRDENDVSMLCHVVDSGNVEAVRYLLDLGVTIPSSTIEVHERQCDKCKENTLIIPHNKWEIHGSLDPCMRAIGHNNLEIVKLLDERGSQTCKSFSTLRHAVRFRIVDVISYLLSKYTYPLNIEYNTNPTESKQRYTLLTELNCNTISEFAFQIIYLLLDHGADPAKAMCTARSANAIMNAIFYGNLKVIAVYIRSGIDINFRSYHISHEKVLPFEASALDGYHNVAEMLLISGCSCGVFSLDKNHKFKNNLKPEVEKLMKEWKVRENNVTPLKQRCRCVILNHLSPRADMKIGMLPLPRLIIKFLGIPELDNIVSKYSKDC